MIPLVGSQPSTSITDSTRDTERAHTVSGARLHHRSSSTLQANASNLFTVKPSRPKTAGKNLKRDGATAPSLSILTPLSSDLMHSSYQSSSNYEGDEEKDEDSLGSDSLPSLTRLTKCEQSALKLPRPPPVSIVIFIYLFLLLYLFLVHKI